MAYSARSVPTEDYIYHGEQVSEFQWGPILNNTTEEDTKEETKEEKPDEGKSEEDKSDKDKESEEDYDRAPFYRRTIDDQFSFISRTLGDTHLSTSPNDSSGGSDVSRDMEGHNRRTDISGPVNTSRWRQSSDQFPTTEESSDSDFSLIRTDSGTSGELFPSYSTSPDSSHLVGATDTTPSSLEGTASSYDPTSSPLDTFSSSLLDNLGSYESDTQNFASASSTYGGSSTLGGSSTYGTYSTYQLDDSSNTPPEASSPYQIDTSIGCVDVNSSVYPYEDSSNTRYGDSPAYSYDGLSSSTYESSSSYSYGGTSDSAYETSWGSNHPY